MGKHRGPEAPKGYKGVHRAGRHTQERQAEAQKPGGFRPGDPERFKRLNEGRGDWFTER